MYKNALSLQITREVRLFSLTRSTKNKLKLAAQKRCVAVFETNDRSAFAPRSSQTVKIP